MSPSKPIRVLITAGPTHEPIDAVRYIANRSSGTMGIALAGATSARGWPTTLLLGPVSAAPQESSHLRVQRFRTAADLERLLLDLWPQHDLLLMAAAVADYTPAAPLESGKVRRTGEPLKLELRPTPDLLAQAAATKQPHQCLVGFALEPPERLMDSAREKLVRKGVDAIVANPLETMDSPRISATLLLRDGQSIAAPANLKKDAFASWLLDEISSLFPGGERVRR